MSEFKEDFDFSIIFKKIEEYSAEAEECGEAINREELEEIRKLREIVLESTHHAPASFTTSG